MSKHTKSIIIIGFAVFAMFFGAGNMIFPPYIGREAGSQNLTVMLGFLFSGVGLPLLGILSCSRAGGNMSDLLGKVNKPFTLILGIAIVLAIGPLYAIPRTAATTHEMMVLPILPGASPYLSSLAFFAITFFLVARPSRVVDNIGTILTPALLGILLLIIAKGILMPLGPVVDPVQPQSFGKGVVEGYQTMDAIVSIIFASIILKELKTLGITETKTQQRLTLQAGMIAAGLLCIVYYGLSHLGASASGVAPQGLDRVALLKYIVESHWGFVGKVGLGLAVGLACLTTSIGLVASVAEYFQDLSKGKLPYQLVALVTCVVGFALSILGVSGLLDMVGPFLSLIYPPVMVIILLNLMGERLQKRGVYLFAVIATMVASAISTFADAFPTELLLKLNGFIRSMPLGTQGFGWLVFTLGGILLGLIAVKLFSRSTLAEPV